MTTSRHSAEPDVVPASAPGLGKAASNLTNPSTGDLGPPEPAPRLTSVLFFCLAAPRGAH